MEILYIYLDNFRNFRKQGISFSSEFFFNTDVVNNEIRIITNPKYIPSFFENPDVLNVTAIIGQNGTGKTNILEFIKSSFPAGMGGFSEDIIVAIRTDDSQLQLYKSESLTIEIIDTEKLFPEPFVLESVNKMEAISLNNRIDAFHSTTFIYYSNIVDLKLPSNLTVSKFRGEEEMVSHSGFQNISTMALLAEDQINFSNGVKVKIDRVDSYKAREVGRNIEFILSEHKKLIKFPLPDQLYFYLLTADEQQLAENFEYKWVFDKIYAYEKDFIRNNSNGDGMWFYNNFLRSVFFNIVRSNFQFGSIGIPKTFIETLAGKDFNEFFRGIIAEMKKGLVDGYNADFLREKAYLIEKFIDFIFEALVKSQKQLVVYEEALFRLPIDKTLTPFNAIDFIDLYVQVKNITDFISFKWRNLSSGEQAMLSLVSRFYKLCDGRDYSTLDKNLIILIDEGDLYYHPEWQRQFMYDLLQFIPQIFQGRKIQFILTANTPYLASDLPKSNIVFIERNEAYGSIVVNPENRKEETFAANIHTLLSDSFYVSSFLGEFAKKKIEKIISNLKSTDSLVDFISKEDLKKNIEIIGEKIIRDRLLDMYFEIYPRELLTAQEELKLTEAKLVEVKKLLLDQIKNKKND